MRHSTAVMSDESGRIISSYRTPGEPISLHTSPRPILQDRLTRLFTGVLRDGGYGLADLRSATVCVGLTGVTFKYHRHLIVPELFRTWGLECSNLIVTGDVEIVFASHAQSLSGSAVLCHSGCTAYVITSKGGQTRQYRVGGWGPVFGDEGSGFWIGCEALRSIAAEHDCHEVPDSILCQEMLGWLNDPQPAVNAWKIGSEYWKIAVRDFVQSVGAIGLCVDKRTLLYHFAHNMQQQGLVPDYRDLEGIELWRQAASGLVIPVLRAWRKGDLEAQRIIQAAVGHLCSQHSRACQIARKEASPIEVSPVVLYGGVLNCNSDFRQMMQTELEGSVGERIEFLTPAVPGTLRPACGALLFALGQSITGDLRLPSPGIIARVLETHTLQSVAEDLRND